MPVPSIASRCPRATGSCATSPTAGWPPSGRPRTSCSAAWWRSRSSPRLRRGRARQPPLPARGARRRAAVGSATSSRSTTSASTTAARSWSWSTSPAARWPIACAAAATIPRALALRWLREAADALDCAHAPRRRPPRRQARQPAARRARPPGRGRLRDRPVATEASLTQTGQVLGTAAYISPEQARGQPATAASDRYALAVVAFELLTGRRPFTADHPAAQARAHVEDRVPVGQRRRPRLPPRVDRVLATGMAKDPAQRPATAADFLDALEDAIDGEIAPAGPPTAVTAPVAPAPAHADDPLGPRRARPRPSAAGPAWPPWPPSRSWPARPSRSPPGAAARAAARRRQRQAREHSGTQQRRSPRPSPRPPRRRPRPTRRRRPRRNPAAGDHAGSAGGAGQVRRPRRAQRPGLRAHRPGQARPTPSRRCSARSRPSAPRGARPTSATPTRSTTSATPCA